MKKLKEIKTKLENNVIFKIARGALYAFVGLLLLVIIVQKVTNNRLTIGNIYIFEVASESMVPDYKLGDIIVVKKVS